MLHIDPVAETRILNAVDALEPEMLDALSALVRTPSVTPKYPGLNYAETVGGEMVPATERPQVRVGLAGQG